MADCYATHRLRFIKDLLFYIRGIMDKLLILPVLLMLLMPSALALTNDQLIQTYAPVMKFNGNEIFYPAPVEYYVPECAVKQGGSLIDSAPTLSSIAVQEMSDYYLDNNLGWFDQIAADYKSKVSSLRPTIYAHIGQSGVYTAVQYWFFYGFNNGPLNNHEGDWEQITVILSGDAPQWATYSQHQGGEKASWSDVEKMGTHPVVYVARGSHANYFRAYEGKLGIQNDEVGGDGVTIAPEQMTVVSLDVGNGWTSFGGRWGDSGGGIASDITGSNGPYGPRTGDHKNTWENPVAWAGSQQGTNGGTFLLNFLLFYFVLLFAVYMIIRVAIKSVWIFKHYKRGELQVRQLLSSSFAVWLILGIVGTVIVFFGIMASWYSVSGDIQGSEVQTQGAIPLMDIDGMSGMQVNTLQKGAGMTTIFNAKVPFGLLVLAGVIFTILDLIGARSGKGVGLRYVLGGIMPIVAFVFIIVAVAALGSLVSGITPMLGQEGIPTETMGLVNSVAASPLSGGYRGYIGGYALDIRWGLGLGAYLMLIGGIIKIIAGMAMVASAPKSTLQTLPPVNHSVVVQYSQQAPYYNPAESQIRVRQCTKCGSYAQNGDSFCQVCGTRMA